MPIYEYECESCHSIFEKMQKFSDDPLTVHEDCGGHVRRRMTAPSLQFKGTGWYITDYGRGGKVPANGGDKSEKGEKGEKSDKADKSDKSGSETSKESTASKSESTSSSAPAPAASNAATTSSDK